MSHDSTYWTNFYDAEVPLTFQADSLDVVARAYLDAANYCYSDPGLPPEVAHDHIANRRREFIDTRWPAIAKRHSGVSWGYHPNNAGNQFHVEFRVGRVVMACCFVDPKVRGTRQALYRDSLARSAQMWFEGMGPDDPPPEAPIFAILEHDAVDYFQTKIGSAYIVILGPNAKPVGRINLLKRFPSIFAAEPDTSPVNVIDETLGLETILQVRQAEDKKTS